MAALLPIPPYGSALFDPSTGQMTDVWRNYYLSLEDALTAESAPRDARYLVAETNVELTDEVNLGALATGYVYSTEAAGVSTVSTVASIPSGDITGEALTRTNDTNVTLTLGGAPGSALLNATSITAGWTGTLAVGRGGTGASLAATGGASQVLKQTSVGGAVTVGQLAVTDLSDVSNVALKNGTNAFTGTNTFPAGAGTSTVRPTGTVSAITTGVTTTGTTEEVLATYTMPANTLSANGQSLRITGGWDEAANANTKVIRIRIGGLAGTLIMNYLFGGGVGTGWFDALLTRRTSTTASGTSLASSSSGATTTDRRNVTTDFTAAIDVVVTGLTASAAGDFTLQQAVFDYRG